MQGDHRRHVLFRSNTVCGRVSASETMPSIPTLKERSLTLVVFPQRGKRNLVLLRTVFSTILFHLSRFHFIPASNVSVTLPVFFQLLDSFLGRSVLRKVYINPFLLQELP